MEILVIKIVLVMKAILTDGGVQWMTAGKGVVHSEMPEQKEGLVRGFQLWLNLPKGKEDD